MALTGNEQDVLERIESKLDQILRIAALQMTAGLKQTAAIKGLAAAGFDRNLIAELLDTTPNTVSVTLSTLKRSKAKQSSKPRQIRMAE
jgi:DNA-binding CsgD family transcriptional regulator